MINSILMKVISKLFGKGKVSQYIILILVVLLLSKGLNCMKWPLHGRTPQVVMSLFIVVIFFMKCKLTIRQHFRYYVLFLAIYPFFSIIYSFTEYGQPIFDGFKATFPSLIWLSYFLLHRFKMKEASIMRVFFYIALFILAVQVIQQFTYPKVLFGAFLEDSSGFDEILVSKRNGLWRFRMGFNGYFTALSAFVIWVKNKKMPLKTMLTLFFMMFVSIYLTLTRQVIIAFLLTFIFSYFMNKERLKFWNLVIGLFIISFIFAYSEQLFGSLMEKTREELTNDYIRFVSGKYFLNETLSSVKAMLLGHGIPALGAYQQLSVDLQDRHYYVSDVGFIGAMYNYGIPFALVCYALLLNIFFVWQKAIPSYIRMFVVFTTIMSLMIFPMYGPLHFFVWSCIIYMCDLHINQYRGMIDQKMEDERRKVEKGRKKKKWKLRWRSEGYNYEL